MSGRWKLWSMIVVGALLLVLVVLVGGRALYTYNVVRHHVVYISTNLDMETHTPGWELLPFRKGDLISNEDLDRAVNIYQLIYSIIVSPDNNQYDPNYAFNNKEQVLEEMIVSKLLVEAAYHEFKEDIEAEQHDFVQEMMEWLQTVRYGSAEAWQDVLLTYEVDEQDFVFHLRTSYVVARYKELVTAEIVLSDDEIEAYYEDNKDVYSWPDSINARHILVQDIALAQELLQRLNGGEDFAEIAQAYSIDKGSAAHGGSLGWFGPGIMIPEFDQVAFGLAEGEHSGIVKSGEGYHIIKVDEISKGKERPLSEVHTLVELDLLEERRIDVWQMYINDLWQAVQVQRLGP